MRCWMPEGRPRGIIVLSHGFNSHSGYYLWAAEQLLASRLAVYALDYRGRGKSDGERYFVESFPVPERPGHDRASLRARAIPDCRCSSSATAPAASSPATTCWITSRRLRA
jgi:pimeloyl-ACP methyl ester carboxylesterase